MTAPELKLAVLVHDLSATGVVRNAIRIAAHMASRGHRAELWVVRDTGAFRAEVPANVAIRCLGTGPQISVRRLDTRLAAARIAEAIGVYRPAVLLSAGNHFHLAAGRAYRLAGKPHSTRLMGRASNATPRIGRRLPFLAAIAHAIDARKYRDMERIIAVSHELAASLYRDLGIARGRIAVVPNGVDTAVIAMQAEAPLDDPWFAPDAPPVIVSAGRLTRQKNYPLLLHAFARLRQERPARLVILGEGSASARRKLLQLAKKLGVAGDVHLQGFDVNPMRFFARAALFVLSSRWEGASNVLLEAMACGCPVVATDCPTGVREQLDGGRIGPLVPVDDAAALARAIAGRLDAPRDSDRLMAHAATFSNERMLAAYENLFECPDRVAV